MCPAKVALYRRISTSLTEVSCAVFESGNPLNRNTALLVKARSPAAKWLWCIIVSHTNSWKTDSAKAEDNCIYLADLFERCICRWTRSHFRLGFVSVPTVAVFQSMLVTDLKDKTMVLFSLSLFQEILVLAMSVRCFQLLVSTYFAVTKFTRLTKCKHEQTFLKDGLKQIYTHPVQQVHRPSEKNQVSNALVGANHQCSTLSFRTKNLCNQGSHTHTHRHRQRRHTYTLTQAHTHTHRHTHPPTHKPHTQTAHTNHTHTHTHTLTHI